MNYIILKADLKKNKDDILARWETDFSDTQKNRYEWIYEKNPNGPAYNWLAKDTRTNKFVGSTGLYSRIIMVDGNVLRAGVAVDFFVDKEHRAFGPAINLQKAVISSCQRNGFDFILGFPNRKSEAVHLRVGYLTVGNIYKMVKPLRMETYLQKIFKNEHLSRSLSSLLNPILRIVSKETWYSEKNNLIGEIVYSFDERFDRLWSKVSENFKVIGERTSAYLTWRYFQCPFKKYEVFTLIEEKNRDLLGYIVFYMKDEVSLIADLLAVSKAMLECLLSKYIREMRERHVKSIKYLGCESLTKTLKKFGFISRKEDSKLIIYIDQKHNLAPTILRRENWYFLEGDGDT